MYMAITLSHVITNDRDDESERPLSPKQSIRPDT
jgi:hypothetical protein